MRLSSAQADPCPTKRSRATPSAFCMPMPPNGSRLLPRNGNALPCYNGQRHDEPALPELGGISTNVGTSCGATNGRETGAIAQARAASDGSCRAQQLDE